MAGTTELYRGMIIKFNNEPHVLIEKEFYSPGKGGAFNRTKLQNIKTGKIVSQIFKSGEKVDELDVSTKTVQYLYIDGNNVVFMDPVTFEQISIEMEIIPGKTDWLHGEGKYIAKIYEGDVIYLQVPPKLTLVITDTYDAVKGDTASNAMKDATLETGAVVKVPLFIKNGDKIIVNTDTGTYFAKG
jgi:elongation factor P